jgi:hypothetical protein
MWRKVFKLKHHQILFIGRGILSCLIKVQLILWAKGIVLREKAHKVIIIVLWYKTIVQVRK